MNYKLKKTLKHLEQSESKFHQNKD